MIFYKIRNYTELLYYAAFILTCLYLSIPADIFVFIPGVKIFKNEYTVEFQQITRTYYDEYTKIKIHMNYSNWYTNTYINFEENKLRDIVPYPEGCICTTSFRLYNFTDAFVRGDRIAIETQGFNFYRGPSFNMTFKVANNIRLAITANKFWNTFGHNLHDTLASILAYPKEILDQNPIIFHDWEDGPLIEHLNALGLSNLKPYPHRLHGNQFVRCDRLYCVIPDNEAHEFTGFSLPLMRKLFRETLKLNEIQPINYCLLNRKPNEHRHFTNFGELKSKLSVKHPDINWQMFELHKNFIDRAKEFASIKFLVSSCGSIVYNSLFMKERSAFVVLYGHLVDLPNNALCCKLGMYCIGIQHKNISHYDGKGPMYIDKVLNSVDKLIEAQKIGDYPDMSGYYIFDVKQLFLNRDNMEHKSFIRLV